LRGGKSLSDGDINVDFFYEAEEEVGVLGRVSLTASGIAEYIRFNCCPRFFKLNIAGKEVKTRKWPEAFKPASSLLIGVGKSKKK
jgi:hypothetical protein